MLGLGSAGTTPRCHCYIPQRVLFRHSKSQCLKVELQQIMTVIDIPGAKLHAAMARHESLNRIRFVNLHTQIDSTMSELGFDHDLGQKNTHKLFCLYPFERIIYI